MVLERIKVVCMGRYALGQYISGSCLVRRSGFGAHGL